MCGGNSSSFTTSGHNDLPILARLAPGGSDGVFPARPPSGHSGPLTDSWPCRESGEVFSHPNPSAALHQRTVGLGAGDVIPSVGACPNLADVGGDGSRCSVLESTGYLVSPGPHGGFYSSPLRLDTSVPIHVPSNSSNSPGSGQGGLGAAKVYPSHSLVAPSGLVPLITPPIAPPVPACSGRSPFVRQDTCASETPEADCLVTGLTFLNQVEDILLNSQKPSTRRSYSRKWQRYAIWTFEPLGPGLLLKCDIEFPVKPAISRPQLFFDLSLSGCHLVLPSVNCWTDSVFASLVQEVLEGVT